MTNVSLAESVIRVGGHEVYFAEAGDGPPLVLLHGGGPGASGLSNYSRNVDDLARDHHVIVPDLLGYGRSSKTTNSADPFGHLAMGVRGVLDALGLESATLVGNSYGGAAALRLALETPQRAHRLVLMGPGGIGTTRQPPTAGLKRLLSYYTGAGPSRDKLATFIRRYLVHDGQAVPDDVIDQRFAASIDPEVLANPPLRRPSGPQALRTLWRMDFTRDKRLQSLDIPTLVLWGAQDKVNRPEGGMRLAVVMPDCELLVIPRTGHWVQWERAELFNRLVRAFVAAGRPDVLA